MEKEVLKERERIKKIVETKINARIEWRGKNRASLGFTSHFEKLLEDIMFLIENPNYKGKDIDWSKQKTRRPKSRPKKGYWSDVMK